MDMLYNDFKERQVRSVSNSGLNNLTTYRRKVSDLSSELGLKYDVLLSIKLQDKDTFLRFSNTLPFFQNVMKEGKCVARVYP